MPDRRGRARQLTAILVMVMVAATACVRDDQPDNASATPAAGTVAATVAELCLAATDEQGEGAVRRFQTVHGPLHDLADDTAHSDRAAAARLLEAKQQVEVAIDQPAEPAEMRQRLTWLAHAAVAALTAVEVAVPAVCDDLEPPT